MGQGHEAEVGGDTRNIVRAGSISEMRFFSKRALGILASGNFSRLPIQQSFTPNLR